MSLYQHCVTLSIIQCNILSFYITPLEPQSALASGNSVPLIHTPFRLAGSISCPLNFHTRPTK